MTIPTCVNLGCNNPAHRKNAKTKKNGSPRKARYRPVCAKCHSANIGQSATQYGVVSVKKDYCENKDGRVGLKCPVTDDAFFKIPGVLELDHIDGNHYNNDPANHQTLCCLCHRVKTHENDDSGSTNREELREQRERNDEDHEHDTYVYKENKEHFDSLFRKIKP